MGRKVFSMADYNKYDQLTYNEVLKNCYPFLLPTNHLEDYQIDCVLNDYVLNGVQNSLPVPIGVELEYNSRWAGTRYPFPTIHFVCDKINKYTNYKYKGVVIPTFYAIFDRNCKYIAIAQFGNITGDMKTVYPKNGQGGIEVVLDSPIRNIRIINVQDFGKFFFYVACGKSTKKFWV